MRVNPRQNLCHYRPRCRVFATQSLKWKLTVGISLPIEKPTFMQFGGGSSFGLRRHTPNVYSADCQTQCRADILAQLATSVRGVKSMLMGTRPVLSELPVPPRVAAKTSARVFIIFFL